MKTVSVRDLRYDFPKVEQMLRSGEEIRITKRRKVIARLSPEPALENSGKRQIPDFLGRMKENFGGRVLSVTGAELVSESRDRF